MMTIRYTTKKLISLLLVLIMILYIIPVFADTGNDSLEANFTKTFTNMGISVYADGNGATRTEIEGNECWKTNISGGNLYVYCNVSDSFLYNEKNVPVSITVSYYDEGTGSFCIRYASQGGTAFKESSAVSLTDTKTWMDHTFTFTDMAFNNGSNTFDFCLSLYVSGDVSTCDIAFSKVVVSVDNPFLMAMADTIGGNVYVERSDPAYNLQITNVLGYDKNFIGSFNLYNANDEIINSGEINKTIAANSVSTISIFDDKLDNGVYKLVVSGNGTKETKNNIAISQVESFDATTNEYNDGILGICTHFGHYVFDVDTSMELLKESGVQWIRDGEYWSQVEQTKGVYTFSANTEKYINAAYENGINILFNLSYGNSLYGELTPTTDATREAYANYAKAVATKYKGKIKAYEIWNEWNGGFSDDKAATTYEKLLEYAYTAIKEVDPDAIVVAGACITAATTWFGDLFEAGGYNYCDAISYHPYCSIRTPDTKYYNGDIQDNITKNNDLMRQYGEQKPIWITEMGWHNGEDENSVSDTQQAAYMSRLYLVGSAYGASNIFWYDFQNDGIDTANGEQNFGMITYSKDETPYSAKPNYVAFNAIANRLRGTEFVSEYRPNANIRAYRFKRIDGNGEVVALYSATSDEYTFDLFGNNKTMNIYDMYGNSCNTNTITENPIYLEGEIGQFDPTKISVSEKRERVSLDTGVITATDGIYCDFNGVADTKSYISCWTVDNCKVDSINLDIDDSYVYGTGKNLIISIKYYDEGKDDFYIDYLSGGEQKSSSTIKLTNTCTWKTDSISITDADLNNSFDGIDFKIKKNDAQSESLGVSVKNIAIENVTSQDFYLEFDPETKIAKISGVSENMDSVFGNNVSIQILYPGKTEQDLLNATPAQLPQIVRYVNQTPVNDLGVYSIQLKMTADEGEYLVRVVLPGGENALTKTLNYQLRSDITDMILTNGVDTISSPIGQSSLNFSGKLSQAFDGTVIAVMCLYDSNGSLKAIKTSECSSTHVNVGLELLSPVTEGQFVKVFVLSDSANIVPIIKPVCIGN